MTLVWRDVRWYEFGQSNVIICIFEVIIFYGKEEEKN